MPRSAKHQKSIDRHRQSYKPTPRPKHGEKSPTSWWLGLSGEAFSAEAREQIKRMAPHAGIAGDRGVTY